jgi:hypothetical protein
MAALIDTRHTPQSKMPSERTPRGIRPALMQAPRMKDCATNNHEKR